MTFDVAVIGGGPSGAVAAAFLAMGGASVVLVEASAFPRYQVGESLMVSTIHGICKRLGALDAVLAAGFIRKPGGVFRWGPSKDLWTLAFTQATELAGEDANFALHVERLKFDAILLDTARRNGVDVRVGSAVREIVFSGDTPCGVTIQTTDGVQDFVGCRFVVDASGAASRFARHVGERVGSQFFNNIAFYGYFDHADRLPAPLQGGGITEAFSKGWAWFLPIAQDLTSVGVVLGAEMHQRDEPQAVLRRLLPDCPHISRLLAPAAHCTRPPYSAFRIRRDFSYTTDRLVRNRMFLIGDSAAFLDPLFTTGVHLGTYSGLLAARTILSIIDDCDKESELCAEFEARYRYEYELFYHYVVAYYDAHHDSDSEFWSNRKVATTRERQNERFIDIVSQGRDTADAYISSKQGIGAFVQDRIAHLRRIGNGAEKAEFCRRMAEDIHFTFPPPSGARPFHLGFQDVRAMARNDRVVTDAAAGLAFDPSTDGLRWADRVAALA